MTYRPRYPKPDKDQRQCIDDLKEAGCIVIETCRLPGEALDFLVFRPDFRACVLVEFKNHIGQKFEDSEIETLTAAGIWDHPGPFSPPPGCCVMAAYRAGDILRHLGMEGREPTPMPEPTSSTIIRKP